MAETRFAQTPAPPYYAVMFTTRRTKTDEAGYGRMAQLMEKLSHAMPGYLGIESTRDAEGFGITVSYWESELAILHWKREISHLAAQQAGRTRWYEHYDVRVARVERAYNGPGGRLSTT